MDVYLETIGIIGGLCVLLGFIQVASNRWNGRSAWYEATNLIGALLLGYYAYHKQAYTNIVLNLVWGTIALYAMHHTFERYHKRKSSKKR